MTISHLWNSVTVNFLLIHLWQSTAFAVLVWLLALTMRDCPARARFSVWMAASIKFLVPFALLAALGSHWARPNPGPSMQATLYTVIHQINQPFTSNDLPAYDPDHTHPDGRWISIALPAIWLCGCCVTLLRLAWQWGSAHRLVREASSLAQGREVDALRRIEAKTRIRKPILIVGTSRAVEPGIFGVMRSVLMWPIGLSGRLDDAHIAAIMTHELEHVQRRDNLMAAVHSLAEIVFWFHPAVWWIGAKMIEERERACDEKVLENNVEPQTYADSVLKVCAFCLESPLPCMAGVSGSDLKKRVLRITRYRSGHALSLSRRTLLIAVAVFAFTLPIGFGIVSGQSSTGNSVTAKSDMTYEALQFDVVSIKPTPSSEDKTLFQVFPDGTSFHGSPLRMVLETAFGVDDNRIIGAPAWVNTDRYDIEAKVAPEDASRLGKMKSDQRNAMLIPLLSERFHLKYHHESREQPMYDLVVAKGGPRLTKGEPDPPGGIKPNNGEPTDPAKEHYKIMTVPGHIEADSIPMYVLADVLTRLHALGRVVVDKTGLTGNYNFTLRWTPEGPFPPMLIGGESDLGQANNGDATSSSLLTAIQEQLGLKLVPDKKSFDVIVIDRVDPPSPN